MTENHLHFVPTLTPYLCKSLVNVYRFRVHVYKIKYMHTHSLSCAITTGCRFTTTVDDARTRASFMISPWAQGYCFSVQWDYCGPQLLINIVATVYYFVVVSPTNGHLSVSNICPTWPMIFKVRALTVDAAVVWCCSPGKAVGLLCVFFVHNFLIVVITP